MRRALATTLLLAAALSPAAALPPRACAGLPAGQPALTDCELLKKLFCHKANQMAENNQLKTWKVFDDYDEYIDKKQGVRYDDSLEDTRKWMFPSQFGRLQRGFKDPEIRYYQPQHDSRNYRHYGKADLPNIKMFYLRNKDILVENDKAYFVYDSYVASTNPIDFLSVRFLCAAGTDSDLDKLAELESQETNDINPLMENTVRKRDDLLETGQKEVPDDLIFSEEEKGDVRKKLFALWSRLQSLTPKGRQLPARRHAFVLYGRDALSAETRAARLRPSGQPLRWG